LYISLIKFQ